MTDERSKDIRHRLAVDFVKVFDQWLDPGFIDMDDLENGVLGAVVDVAMGQVDPLLDQIDDLSENMVRVPLIHGEPVVPTGYEGATETHEDQGHWSPIRTGEDR